MKISRYSYMHKKINLDALLWLYNIVALLFLLYYGIVLYYGYIIKKVNYTE